MPKFKKISTMAKVGTGTVLTAVAGVAIIPIINQFVDNPKARVTTYSYKGILYKTKAAAEDARNKFQAMSDLVSVMKKDSTLTPNVDLKPLMAEFVSFVSKLFVVKVFEMDKETSVKTNFKYDGLSDEELAKLQQKEIAGQIHYGDLKDITSLVKYAKAHYDGNEWMYTPVDQMMLSVLGDGSGESYTSSELKYAEISEAIAKLKNKYDTYYKGLIQDGFQMAKELVAYKDVPGMTHNKDKSLVAADYAKGSKPEDGDGSGDTYTQDFIQKFQQWGTLKTTFENSKTDLDTFVSANSINPAIKIVFEDLVANNAVAGWNNIERFSTDEIRLRDLLAKVASENSALGSSVIPGGHTDTSVSILHGWNWSPTGDRSGRFYEDWQLSLAQDIKDREKLIALHLTSAPDGATEGMNYAPTGDGTGNNYPQEVFDLKQDLKDTGETIGNLEQAINAAISAATVAAPKDGVRGVDGKHMDLVGLGDDHDYSQSFQTFTQLNTLKAALQSAQQAKASFEDQLKATTMDVNPGHINGKNSEWDLISNILDFDSAIPGTNFMKNYDQDQVDLRDAHALQTYLQQKIEELQKNGVIAAPDGASLDNNAGNGDKTDNYYTQAQIELRDDLAQQGIVAAALKTADGNGVRQAKEGGMLTQSGSHEEQVGLGDNQYYSDYFVETASKYRTMTSALADLKSKLKAITDRNPGLIFTAPDGSTKTFQELHDGFAAVGENTGEEYTQAEIDYTKESGTLSTLQDALKTLNEDLTTLGKDINSVHQSSLNHDATHSLTPEIGENTKASGDHSGHTYTQDDIDYIADLKALKTAFPKGNPWFTETATASKTSDEAYAALYNDWVKAVKGGTVAHNVAKVGDGTDRDFSDKDFEFDIVNSFFKDTFAGLHQEHGAPGSSRGAMEEALKTITDYWKKHGTLTPAGGYPKLTDGYTSGDTTRSGDGSGHTYTDIADVYKSLKEGYIDSHSQNRDILRDQALLDKWKLILNDPSSVQKIIDDANAKITAYNTELAKLKAAKDSASSDYDSKDSDWDDAKALPGKITSMHGKHESDIKILAALALSDNSAGAFTPEEAAELAELNAIDGKITLAQSAFKSASEAWAKIPRDEHDDYQRYSKLGDKVNYMIVGLNAIGIGVADGQTYTEDQIGGRDKLQDIKDEIAKHFSTETQQKAELTKILKLQSASSNGLNADSSSDKPSGDQSGLSWESWEIKQLTNVRYVNTLITKIGLNHFAPIGAVQDKNSEATGDGSGNTYDSDNDKNFIQNVIPKYKRMQQAVADTAKSLKDLKARKKELSDLKLDPNKNLDPGKYFKTPKGKVFKLSDFSGSKSWADVLKDAKDWVAKTDAAKVLETKASASKVTRDKAAKEYNDYVKNNSNDLEKWNKLVTDNQKLIHDATQNNIDRYTKFISDNQKQLDDINKILRPWFEAHKGKYVDADQSDGPLKGVKFADTFENFVERTTSTKNGSLYSIFRKLDGLHANLDGSVNIKPTSKFTNEDIDLANALKSFVKIPSGWGTQSTVKLATAAFINLYESYAQAVDQHGKSNGVDRTPEGYTKYQHTHGENFYLNGTKTKLDISFEFKEEDKIEATINKFTEWVKTFYTGETLKHNVAAVGNGKDVDYNSAFFAENKKEFKTEDDIKASTLGAKALKVSQLFGKTQAMGDKAIKGLNAVATGDGSGNAYEQKDIDFFNKVKERNDKVKEVNTQVGVVDALKPTDGTFLMMAPDGTVATPGITKHQAPKGDGSGNTYTQSLIDDIRDYFGYANLEKSKEQEIKDLETEYASKATAPSDRPWSEIQSVDELVAGGLNHETWWTQEEIDYHGKNVQAAKIGEDIKALLSQSILDPSKAGVDGGGTTEKVKIFPAPHDAVFGYNAAPKGNQSGNSYDDKQIAKRDDLKALQAELTAINTEVARLEAIVKNEGVSEAPEGEVAFVAPATWHKENVGDGSGNNYDQKIFDDRLKLEQLKKDSEEADKKLKDFKTKTGESALKTVIGEFTPHMVNGIMRKAVDGLNNAERYSDAEIALRDNKNLKLSTEDHLGTISQGDLYTIEQTLTEDSQPGENVKKVGLGNDQPYTADQLKLRDLIEKIDAEETLHNILSERAMAQVLTYHNEDESLDQIESSKPIETTLGITYREFFTSLDLLSAKVGANHIERGDASNAYYDDGEVNAFSDIVSLQAQKDKDDTELNALLDKGTKPAPLSAVAVTQEEIDKAVAADPSFSAKAGEHIAATGDATGNIYTQAYLDEAAEFVRLQKEYDNAKKAFDDFVTINAFQVKFFEYKTRNGIDWRPIVGRNFTDYQFELKDDLDNRDALKVGRTMVSVDEDHPSSFGTNRGRLGGDSENGNQYVMYKGMDSHIKEEQLGSDKARIGYVLNPSGSSIIPQNAPVLSSLSAVASYLEDHPSLAPKALIDKFAILATLDIKHKDADDEITQVIVSKDRFRSMEENYKWGDK